MVTKQEVIDHYANARALPGIGPGYCPRAVLEALDAMAEDEYGLYDLAFELFDGLERRYLTLDEVKESVRASIDDQIAELRKIQAI